MPVREISLDENLVPFIRELPPEEEIFQEELVQGPLPPSPLEAFGIEANIGISEGFGGPVDLMSGLMNLASREATRFANIFLDPSEQTPERRIEAPQIRGALGSSEQIRGGFEALGLVPPAGEEPPDSLAGSVGRVTGASLPLFLGLGPAAKASREVSAGIRAAPTTARGSIVQDIGRSAIETPGRFLASEAAAIAGAGTGGFIAREKFPDSPAASFIGEFSGGLSPAGVVLAARAVPTVIGARLAKAALEPFTKSGGRRRAENRLQDVARDPDKALTELTADETLPGLTPAQQTGDEGLLSLERAVIESSEKLIGQSDEQIAQATDAIRKSIGDFGEGVPLEKTTEALEAARKHIQSLMDVRMRIAARKADERIGELGPDATREQANAVTGEEIVAARKAVNDQVNEFWDAVPESVLLPTKGATDKFSSIVGGTARAQRDDIPEIAKRFLDPESNEKLAAEETVKELQGLRSKLLEAARTARSEGKANSARIADDLAEAVLADLGAQRDAVKGEAGEALRLALDATADMKTRFDKGTVGKLLAVDKRGAARVPAELTLETTVGKGGPRARVEMQAILEAADTPALRGAVEDFMLDDFQRRAVTNGSIDTKKAQTFLARNQDVLEDFPELRTRIEKGIEAGDLASLRTAQAEGLAKRLGDPKVSRAAVFLKEPVEDAMNRVAKSPKPDKILREVIKQSRRDTTGDALKGLKTGFGDFLLERASTRTPTAAGDFLVSGTVLKRLLNEGPVAKMAKTLLSPDEQKRLLDYADVAEKIEKAAKAKPAKGGVIQDAPSRLLETVAAILGAKAGRALNTGTIQTPGLVASQFKRILNSARKIVGDPARRLLLDAIEDKNLFEALLMQEGTPADTKFVRKQLNAWLLSIGAEQIQDER